jgi:hypothetical protein
VEWIGLNHLVSIKGLRMSVTDGYPVSFLYVIISLYHKPQVLLTEK